MVAATNLLMEKHCCIKTMVFSSTSSSSLILRSLLLVGVLFLLGGEVQGVKFGLGDHKMEGDKVTLNSGWNKVEHKGSLDSLKGLKDACKDIEWGETFV
jgi:hypothetical protein